MRGVGVLCGNFFFSRPKSEIIFGRFFSLQIWTPCSLKRRDPTKFVWGGVILFGRDPTSGGRHRGKHAYFSKKNRARFWMLRILKRQESEEKNIPTVLSIEIWPPEKKNLVSVARKFFFTIYIYIYR